jgi:hypothetical protein
VAAFAVLAAFSLSLGCGDQAREDNAARDGAAGDGNGPLIVSAEDLPKILLEAEEATCTLPFKREDDADASGGHCLGLPSKGCDGTLHLHIAEEGEPARTAGSAAIEFSAPQAGEYVLWMRKWTCCSCGDSWNIAIDGGRPDTMGNQGTTHRHWAWMLHSDAEGPVVFKLAAGRHTLSIANRGESGFRIDQVLFSADHKRVPQGVERKKPGKEAADAH